MPAVAKRLKNVSWECIHFFEDQDDWETIGEALEADGIRLVQAELHGAGKQSLLRTLATSLEFPDYFGMNWDALVDCLQDFTWSPLDRGLVLVIKGSNDFWASEPRTAGTLVEIWLSSAEFWSKQGGGVAFHLIFDLTS